MCDRSTIDWATVFNQKNAGQQCHSSCVLVEPRRSGAGGSEYHCDTQGVSTRNDTSIFINHI